MVYRTLKHHEVSNFDADGTPKNTIELLRNSGRVNFDEISEKDTRIVKKKLYYVKQKLNKLKNEMLMNPTQAVNYIILNYIY